MMSELSQAPLCDRHGCEKVKINDRRRKEGWFWRCRQCNGESRKRYYDSHIRGNHERMDLENARHRERYATDESVRRAVIERTTAYRERNRKHLNERVRSLRAYQKAYDKARWAANKEQQTWERIEKLYGLTRQDYEKLLDRQGHCCAICKSPEAKTKKIKHLKFLVDHCHATGEVRGLLCHPCNSAIGMLGDDPSRLASAIEYLNGGARSLVSSVLHCVDEGYRDRAG
jgi:hypothetical protein